MSLNNMATSPDFEVELCHLEDNGLPFLFILKEDVNTA
jgi:hypothetical protein